MGSRSYIYKPRCRYAKNRKFLAMFFAAMKNSHENSLKLFPEFDDIIFVGVNNGQD